MCRLSNCKIHHIFLSPGPPDLCVSEVKLLGDRNGEYLVEARTPKHFWNETGEFMGGWLG